MTIFTIIIVVGLAAIWISEIFTKRKEDKLREEYEKEKKRILLSYEENVKEVINREPIIRPSNMQVHMGNIHAYDPHFMAREQDSRGRVFAHVGLGVVAGVAIAKALEDDEDTLKSVETFNCYRDSSSLDSSEDSTFSGGEGGDSSGAGASEDWNND